MITETNQNIILLSTTHETIESSCSILLNNNAEKVKNRNKNTESLLYSRYSCAIFHKHYYV